MDHEASTVERTTIVGISEMAVSDDPNELLVTYSLGSCLGLALYDTNLHIGGIVHCMLPSSSLEPGSMDQQPAKYVDSGVPALLTALFKAGATRRGLVAKVAGCASSMDGKSIFHIGERNYAMLRKVLWKNDILIGAEDIGGMRPRTLFLAIETGMTYIRSGDREREL